MPNMEDVREAGEISYKNLFQFVSKFDDGKFLNFCRDYLDIDNNLLERHKMHGDYPDEIKREHIVRSFDTDKRAFVERHFQTLPHKSCYYVFGETGQSRSIPDLKEEDIYDLIDLYKGQGSWIRIAYERFGIEMTEDEIISAPKELTEEQKRTILYQWARLKGNQQTAHEILGRCYREFQRQDRTF